MVHYIAGRVAKEQAAQGATLARPQHDLDAARAESLAKNFGIAQTYTDYRDLIRDPNVDLVSIAVPPDLHKSIALEAIEAGKHVLCEKPLGIDVASCERMIAAAKKAGRTLAVGFNHRYYPCVKFLKQTVDRGGIGTIDHVRALAGHPGLGEIDDGVKDARLDGRGRQYSAQA